MIDKSIGRGLEGPSAMAPILSRPRGMRGFSWTCTSFLFQGDHITASIQFQVETCGESNRKDWSGGVLITIRFVYHSINPLDMRQSVAVEPSFPLISHWSGTPGARFVDIGLVNYRSDLDCLIMTILW